MSNRQPSKAAFQFAAYVPTLTGTLSCIGSTAIVTHILFASHPNDDTTRRRSQRRSPSQRRRHRLWTNPHLRIVLGLSIYDLLYSFNKATLFLTYPKGYGIIGAQGNLTTCSMQGFITQFGYAANVYNTFLSIFFYLTICHGVRTHVFAQRVEPYGHLSISVLFWTLASVGVAIGLYNPTGAFCFIAPFPPRCNGDPDVACERFGESYSLFYEFFAQMWAQISYLIILYTQFNIWYKVHKQEQRILQYSYELHSAMDNPTSADGRRNTTTRLAKVQSQHQKARQVAIQSFLYVAAFFLGVSFTTVYHLIGWIGGYSAFWPLPIINTLAPLQGFWNAFIYARPRYLRIRAQSDATHLGVWGTLRMVFFPTPPPSSSPYNHHYPRAVESPHENDLGWHDKPDASPETPASGDAPNSDPDDEEQRHDREEEDIPRTASNLVRVEDLLQIDVELE